MKFSDFKIGDRFKIVSSDGKPYHGLLGEHDKVILLHPDTEEIEGEKCIAHYTLCRHIKEQPAQLKHSHQS